MCYRCSNGEKEANGYCRACNNARLREKYRREINETPRAYRRKNHDMAAVRSPDEGRGMA